MPQGTEAPPADDAVAMAAVATSASPILALLKTPLGIVVLLVILLGGGGTAGARLLGLQMPAPAADVDYVTEEDLEDYVSSERFQGHVNLVQEKLDTLGENQDSIEEKLDKLLERE